MIKIIPAPLAAGAGAGGGNPFSYINIIAGTITTDTSQLTTTVTRNASGVTFGAAWKLTITDTASAAGSLAMQILGKSAGTSSLFQVDKAGIGTFGSDLQFGGLAASRLVSAGGQMVADAANLYLGMGTGWTLSFGSTASGITGQDSGISRISPSILAVGNGTQGSVIGTLQLTTLDVRSGGSTTISTGVGSVKMSSANPATNAAWIPIAYAGTTYFVPGYTTNSP